MLQSRYPWLKMLPNVIKCYRPLLTHSHIRALIRGKKLKQLLIADLTSAKYENIY